MQKKRLFTIFVVVFLNLLGLGLIIPLLPFYAEKFDASSTTVGLLVSTYAAAQFVGAPLLGRLSDRYGRRPILLISMFGTFVGYILLGVAGALWILFVSRLLDGLTGGNISVARAYITDVTKAEDRAKGLGLIGAAFGLGFIIGPAVGGFLSTGGHYSIPAFTAAGVSFLSLLGIYFWLPETLTPDRRRELSTQRRSAFTLDTFRTALSQPRVGPLLKIGFVFSLVFVTFEGVFSLHAQKHLGLESNQTGYLLAYVGILVTLVQGGLIGHLTKRYTEDKLISWGVVLMGVALLGWAYAPSVWVAMLALAPLSLAAGILGTTIHSALTKTVYTDQVGSILGLATAMESFTRVIGPSIGGALMDWAGTWAPGFLGALLMTILGIYIWTNIASKRHQIEII